ncbi:MAG: hypothetical protein R6W97_13445 [Thiobacillus sp.]
METFIHERFATRYGALYRGSIGLEDSPLGGLGVRVRLPRQPAG